MANHPNRSKSQQQENRVWVELEKPRNKIHGDKQCELANRMLRRLVENTEGLPRFWYEQSINRYCYGGDMGFEELSDCGKWFNLDYLGRP